MSHKKDPTVVKANNAARHKRWRLQTKHKVRANYKRWYYLHHDHSLEVGQKRRDMRTENQIRSERNHHYKRRYGITLEVYEKMLVSQKGVCAICRTDKAGKLGQCFAVDHDLHTGVVRGLLCMRCNSFLGWVQAREEWERKHSETICKYLSQPFVKEPSLEITPA